MRLPAQTTLASPRAAVSSVASFPASPENIPALVVVGNAQPEPNTQPAPNAEPEPTRPARHSATLDATENTLIEGALLSLEQSAFSECERLLRLHASRFPNGDFAEERLWLRVRLEGARGNREFQIAAAEDYVTQYERGVHRRQALALIPIWRRAGVE